MVGSNMRILRKIGKTLLWILLGIIASPLILLVIIIFLILCLGRIKYIVDAKVGDENSAYVNITYFMGLVRYVVTYAKGKTETKGSIAWVKLGKTPPPKAKSKKAAQSLSPSTPKVISTKPSKPPPEPSEPKKEPKKEKKIKKEKEKKDGPGIFGQVKAALTYPNLKTIISLSFQCLHKFVKALKPRHFHVSGVVGLDDPAETAWLMGSYEAAAGVTGLRKHIDLLGSYHEKALHLNIEAKGRTSLGRLLWPFLWLYLKKPVRELIHKNIFK